tara:strand:- start:525 stop:1103 length:579 start_codon:yes stop_codon:yes gene_type:complete
MNRINVQTQTENNNTKISWYDVFQPFSTSVILITIIIHILELIKDDKKRLSSLEVMLLELSISAIYLAGQHLTTYLFILKCINKNVGNKKRYLDIILSVVIIIYLYFRNNITNDFKSGLFVLRFIIHILTLSPISEITLDSITLNIYNQTEFLTEKNYAPTESAIRFGLAHMTIAITEISRLMYSLYYLIKK